MLKRAVLLGIGVVAGAILAGAAISTSPGSTTGLLDRKAVALNGALEVPCNGVETTLSEQRRSAPFDIYKSHHSLANDDNLVKVWDCPGPQLALQYGTDIVVYVGLNTLDNPAEAWAVMAAKYPEFQVGTARGEPASLVDPEESVNDTALGGVDVVIGRLRLTVSGNGSIDLGNLKEIMESLRKE